MGAAGRGVLASRWGEVGAFLQGCWAEAAAGPRTHLLWACRARAACAGGSEGRQHTFFHPASAWAAQ
eukprot:3989911-Prymnesium_polylepis.1